MFARRDATLQADEDSKKDGCGTGCILAIAGILVGILVAVVGVVVVVVCSRKNDADAGGGNVQDFGRSFANNATFSQPDTADGELYDTAAMAVSAAAGQRQPVGAGEDTDGYMVPASGVDDDDYGIMGTGKATYVLTRQTARPPSRHLALPRATRHRVFSFAQWF